MAVETYSRFYYGHTITNTNQFLSLRELGGPEIQAKLTVGSYTLSKFRQVLEKALNEIGNHTYSVTVDRATRILTISADGDFRLLGLTGLQVANGVFSLAGFSGVDTGYDDTHVGNFGSGFEYRPQFWLQDYSDPTRNRSFYNATKSKSADGNMVSVQTFAEERKMKCNLRFITDIQMPDGHPIRSNATGVDDAAAFMDYLVTQAPCEFMLDEDQPDQFYKLLLNSTEQSQDGTEYELRERYDQGIPGYFDTGILEFKVITE